jgi:hypothetical protein
MNKKEEDVLGGAIYKHWVYRSKALAIQDFLQNVRVKEALDVGAGSGIYSRHLLDHNFCSSAVCVDPFYEEEKMEDHNGKPIKFTTSVENVSQNLILMIDVLQSVEDDVSLLKQFADPMPAKGNILIVVPAFSFLWSAHDNFLEHKRRYNIKTLERAVYKAGLEPVKMRFFFSTFYPFAALRGLVDHKLIGFENIKAKNQIYIHPKWFNELMYGVSNLERQSVFKINKLFGTSLFCLCRR